MEITFILLALVVGFGWGLIASREWISRPLWETEAKLRKELGEVRKELLREQTNKVPHFYKGAVAVAHFEIVEPTIEQRSPSDVFFFNNFEDLL